MSSITCTTTTGPLSAGSTSPWHRASFLQYRQVFFMMRRNSCWLTSPSPSLSASSIISFTGVQRKEEDEEKNGAHEAKVWLHLRANVVLTLFENHSCEPTSLTLTVVCVRNIWILLYYIIMCFTCSSSSVRFSPSSLATLFRFLKEILPVSSSSNSRKAFRISSLESFSAWWVRRRRRFLLQAAILQLCSSLNLSI